MDVHDRSIARGTAITSVARPAVVYDVPPGLPEADRRCGGICEVGVTIYSGVDQGVAFAAAQAIAEAMLAAGD
jgi:hypothetical protein